MLLTINTGSSSLKAAIYHSHSLQRPELTLQAARIGHARATVRVIGNRGEVLLDEAQPLSDHDAALSALLKWIHAERPDLALEAIGHRIVYGGANYREARLITPDLVAALRELVPIDPEHLPQALAAIARFTRDDPTVPQIACFDTAFHRDMPWVAQHYALPARYGEAGVLRYGFHGLSYEYVLQALQHENATAAQGRIIIAHLGNGASMVAVRDGVGIETTMGFSPTGGLVMGTRSGDLDPGVLIHLLRAEQFDADRLSELVNGESGLLGVSGSSGDMRELLDREATDPHAAEAIDLFCYTATKHLGALVAVLGGVDTLIFTGGIGEHAAPVRERICAGFAFLGLALDPQRNATTRPIISAATSQVTVRVLPTDEDLIIARHTAQLLARKGAPHVSV